MFLDFKRLTAPKMLDRLREMIGKKVYLEISNNRGYNGQIKEVGETHLVFEDKFGDELFILISEIKLLQPKDRQTENGKQPKSQKS